MNLVNQLWQRITAIQPVPDPIVVASLGVVAVTLIVFGWPVVRMLVTITHEGGHAVVAALTGRTVTGIRLNSDTSGLTLSRGKPTGLGMIATLVAGYVSPGLVGVGAAWLLSTGRAVALLWLVSALLAVMLLFIRNFFGFFTMAAVITVIGAASWYLDPMYQSWVAYGVTWILLLAAPRPVLELFRNPSSTSDAAQLARLTYVGPQAWTVLFFLVTISCLVVGVGLLAPGVVAAWQG